ncbi:Hsp20/alpha crystallin family protein [Paenibacillus sp. GYB003]|uniref:Hsp20/alpha crystallin family protein n=1 Tax=Paenibacillus sp. GYB003 TaxID=2994392 RepID=UPI002F96C612
MDEQRKDMFANFDWKSFEQFFGGKFPLGADLNRDTAWVDRVVKDVMSKALPHPIDVGLLGKHFQTEVFETHNNVIVKIHIPDQETARRIRPYIGFNLLKLEGAADDKTQTVKLTSPIVPESCKAVYKNGVLQLHMRKMKRKEPLREVHVRFLD